MEKISYLHSSCSDELQASEAGEMAKRILHDPAPFTALAWFFSSSLNFPLLLPTPWLQTPKSAGKQICQKTAGKLFFFFFFLSEIFALKSQSLSPLLGMKMQIFNFLHGQREPPKDSAGGDGGGTVWNCKESTACASCFTYKTKAAPEMQRPLLMQRCTQWAARGATDCKHDAGLLPARRKGLCAKTVYCSRLGISLSMAFCLAIWGELTMQTYRRHLTEPCLSPAARILIHKTPSNEPAAGIFPASSTLPLYSSPHVISKDLAVSGLYNFISPCKSSPLWPLSLPLWKHISGNTRKTHFVV